MDGYSPLKISPIKGVRNDDIVSIDSLDQMPRYHEITLALHENMPKPQLDKQEHTDHSVPSSPAHIHPIYHVEMVILIFESNYL